MQDQANQDVSPSAEGADQVATPESALEQQLTETQAKLSEMHDAFMRAKAEGENIRRRGACRPGSQHRRQCAAKRLHDCRPPAASGNRHRGASKINTGC